MRHRTLPDGRIWFPIRGKPPVCPDGYEKTSDPYIFKPVLSECIYRDEKDFIQDCGNKVKKLFCNKENLFVNRGICKRCQE